MPKAPKVVVKKDKAIHPNSRYAASLARKTHHEHRVVKSKSDTATKQEHLREKLLWFQEHLDPDLPVYTKHDLAVLTQTYLTRFDEELEQISIINSVGNRQFLGKQHVPRESAIKLTQEREKKEFESIGIEVPDLINGKNVKYFKDWPGEVRYFPNIKLRRSAKKDIDEKKLLESEIDSDKEETEETEGGSKTE